jgi:hypothetical protein
VVTNEQQFISYQLLDDSDVPSSIWEKATVYDDSVSGKSTLHSMDVVWGHLAMRTIADGSLQFPLLSQVAQVETSHSKRVFSMVLKNKTPLGPTLALKKH